MLSECIDHCYHVGSIIEKLKYQILHALNRRSGEMGNHLFETYKHYLMSHGKNMIKIESDIDMATLWAYPPSEYALPHWKCVMIFCAQCPCIDIQSPESYHHSSNISPTIFFMCITQFHNLLCMTDALFMKRDSANCVMYTLIQ